MKSILTTLFRPISRSKTSHRSSQGVIYGDMIKQSGEDVVVNYDGKLDPNEFDKMYVYHGNDWSGSLNIFGGIENYPAGKLQQFSNFKGEVISLGIPFPCLFVGVHQVRQLALIALQARLPNLPYA